MYWPTGTNYDFFSYYKMVWFLVLTLFALIIFIIGLKYKKIALTKTWIYVPVGIYALTAILSTVFAKHKDAALFGFPDRYEGLFVILGYILVFIITLNVAQNRGALKLILTGLFFSAFFASLIGLFQFIGTIQLFGKTYVLDLFKTSLGQWLIVPGAYRDALTLDFRFAVHQVYTTLYNTNFVGSFMEMTLLLSIVLFIYDPNKKRKLIYCILAMLIFTNWLGCLSRAGYLGAAASILILFIVAVFRYNPLKKESKGSSVRSLCINSILIICLFTVLFLFLNFFSKSTITMQFSRLLDTADRIITASDSDAQPTKTQDIFQTKPKDEIKDIRITPDTIYYSTTDADMKIRLIGNDLQFSTGDGNQLVPTFDKKKNGYVFNYPKYSKFMFNLAKNNVLFLYYRKLIIQVAITNQGFKNYDERFGITDVKEIPSWGFEGMERKATRFYGWSRSIPMLKDTVVLGNGPDTFALHFPQLDYVAKMKYYADPYLIIDKPHNMYLQIALNTGVVSLICVLIIFVSYIATSIKIILTNMTRSIYTTISLGVFLGTTAYMITAFFNDSLISVAPVFWIMLGLGYAVNFVVLGERQQGTVN
ncbi:MAG: hypothetical protein A2X45_06400 [Lentisphaerae bacterium GWF2_50_93]|nr:MAG: hypothetical protein A2X45_06400 [Lentisphaerae bacterium GWF2_50_93]